jgi:hypothetical protein
MKEGALPWLYRPPKADSPEWEGMTNATYLVKTVKLFKPSPCGRCVSWGAVCFGSFE